jgi:hypothetical protein
MKVPLAEQIDAVEFLVALRRDENGSTYPALEAAAATLKWVERHQAELRVLGEFPGATVVRRDEE